MMEWGGQSWLERHENQRTVQRKRHGKEGLCVGDRRSTIPPCPASSQTQPSEEAFVPLSEGRKMRRMTPAYFFHGGTISVDTLGIRRDKRVMPTDCSAIRRREGKIFYDFCKIGPFAYVLRTEGCVFAHC
jgi:hypothetical protein